MKNSLQFLMLLAFIGFSSSQLHAQDATFSETTDDFWTTNANWSLNTPATGIATMTTKADLNGGTFSLDEIIISGTSVTISNGTLTIGSAATGSNSIGNNANDAITTFDCNINLNTNKRIRNTSSSKLIFADGNTLALGVSAVYFHNLSTVNPIELNGIVTGSNSIRFRNELILGTTSDCTDFTGSFNFTGGNDALLTVNGENTIKASISNNQNTTSEVAFNANQNSMANLNLNANTLTLNFDSSVTTVQFSGATITTGIVNLKNYTSGILRIGTTNGIVSQSELNTWLIDGVEPIDGTLVQDSDGYITKVIPISVTYTSTTGQSMNWEDTTTWVGGVVPNASSDNIIIHGLISINSDVNVNNFTIVNIDGTDTEKERIIVTPGYSLIVNGDTVTRNGQLFAQSQSDSFASLIFKGAVDGDIRYYRYVNASPGNDLISTPATRVFSDFTAENGELFKNPATPTQKLFGPFDTAAGEYLIWDESTNGAENIVPGIGYRTATNTGSTLLIRAEVASPSVDVPVGISDGGHATYGTWNLIGNPFPSYLDFATFFTANVSQFDNNFAAVYGYNGAATGNKWEIYNAMNLPPDGKITPAQGFFVKTKTGGGTVTFTPTMRTIGNADDFISGRSSDNLNIALAKLNLSTASDHYSTDIYFADNQTRGLDPGYDAGAYVGASNGIYTNLVENNTGIDMAIQALPYDDFNDVVVPLSTNGEAGIQLTIGLDIETVSIPSNINVYLEDNVTNTWTLLNTGDYVFTPSSALNGTGRFYVHFSNTTLALNENVLNGLDIHTEQSSKTVVVKGQLNTDTTAVIYDVQGRLVVQNALNASNTTNTINVNALKAGIYIVELKSNTQNRTQKIIIK
ncbi:T9SS type A sorting domain-containing protein [Winogradskyella helgolandensis]|uniref:T9SS type A sorting domain-containing protein n=1 Tax=Winogradskyella helgolandensis TaxID=2697010 RepID=UPI0015BA80D3|nr:T9SS type A sorting domain-containing protein [Winogradskyella helgolandensis]